MDVKVFLISLLVFVNLELKKTEATIPGIILSMTDDGNRNDKKTATCTLKMDDVETSSSTKTRGDNSGIQGIPGLDGLPGEKGSMGDVGLPGWNGIRGDKGLSGKKGFPGQDGLTGPTGSGHMGNMIGEPGIAGPPGYKGQTGDKGVCGCTAEDPLKFGTKVSPATVTCKSAPHGVLSGTYYLGPPAQPFKVFCNMETEETCIRRDTNDTDEFILLSLRNENTWLSSKISDVSKNNFFYNNLSTKQIMWLQMRSTTARQRLSFKCRNVKDFDLSSAVLLLTWNDIVIGPNRTSEYPFSYYVNTSVDSSAYTSVIELKTTKVNRLPVTDMWLEDIGDFEEYADDLFELCFR